MLEALSLILNLLAFHSLYSLSIKNKAGKPLSPVATVSMRNVDLHPAESFTTPIKIWPKILPKPAIPSIIPETVARAF